MPITTFPIATSPVTAPVATFMGSANQAGMQTAIGLDAILAAIQVQISALAPKALIQDFIVAGDYPVSFPSGYKLLTIIAVGSGSGGGSGRRGAAGSYRGGGTGGAGGNWITASYSVDDMDKSGPLTVSVPVGGTGGAAVTTDDTDGNPGGSGFTCIVSDALGSPLCAADGGLDSFGGSTAPISGPTAGAPTNTLYPGGNGGNSSDVAGGQGGTALIAASGGGAGGGINSANTEARGGNSGAASDNITSLPNASGGNARQNGQNGNAGEVFQLFPGHGGGGGGANKVATAGHGGNGVYGGGGGGGGASLNGFSSGFGGNGADGFVRLVWI